MQAKAAKTSDRSTTLFRSTTLTVARSSEAVLCGFKYAAHEVEADALVVYPRPRTI